MTEVSAVAEPGRPLRRSDPTELGPYRLLRRLGEGGMGSVYLAQPIEGGPASREPASGRQLVALKAIRADLAGDPDFRRRFRSEVARAQQVPAFCTAEVLAADPDHEPPYLVVEFVNGPSLARVVADQGPLSPANLHGLAIGVATALTAIHGAGVIHRDLKPANVLLALGSPKVIDFGIARAAEGTALTETGNNQLIGTIAYMAPERLDSGLGKPLTPAADIFSWGAVVAFAGTGRTPFGNGTVEAAARILTQPPDLTGLTGDLRDLVERALAKDPQARPTARELLDHLVAGGPRPTQQRLIEAGSEQAVVSVASASDTTRLVEPRPARPPRQSQPPGERRRGRLLASLLALSIVALTATVVGILTGVIRPLDGLAQDQNPLAGSPGSTPTPSPTPTPSATATASPTPTASTASPTPEPSRLRIDVVKESLNAPSKYFFTRDETALPSVKGKCVVDKGMRATHLLKATYRCPMHPDPLTDLVTYLDATLLTEQTCAAVWFHLGANKGYLLTACRDVYQVWSHNGSQQEVLKTSTGLARPNELNVRFRIGILVEGKSIRVFHNGEEVINFSSGLYPRGQVGVGVYAPAEAQTLPAYEVLFANLEIYALN